MGLKGAMMKRCEDALELGRILAKKWRGLEMRLAAIEARLDALEGGQADLDELQNRVEFLEATMDGGNPDDRIVAQPDSGRKDEAETQVE